MIYGINDLDHDIMIVWKWH